MTQDPRIAMVAAPTIGRVQLRPFHIYFPRADVIGCGWGRFEGSVVNAGWAHLIDDMLCHECASHLAVQASTQPPPGASLV